MKKNRTRAHHLAASFVLLLFWATPAPAASLNAETAINNAGRQRMLSQRIVKAYCQVGLDIQIESSKRDLQESVTLFENQLAELKQYAPTAEIKQALERVATTWGPFKSIATAPVTRDGAKKLIGIDDELLFVSDKVVLLLQDYANAPSARLVNVSGRQRMLSQRIAKFYMLKSWGFESATVTTGLAQAKNEFHGALIELETATENTPEITQDLSMARSQWRVLEHFIDREKEPMPLFMVQTSEKVLRNADALTTKYEALLARRTAQR